MDDSDELQSISERPIYIRRNVKSFSNYDPILTTTDEIQKQLSIKELMNLTQNFESENDFALSNKSEFAPVILIKRSYSFPTNCNEAFTNFVNNLFENPDGRMTTSQKATIIVFSCFEAYRTIISSFLTVFVPQNCDGYSCTILQNIIPKDDLETTAISFNSFMALYFCVLFTIERIRESAVKEYLIADKSSPTDKEYLIKMIAEMNPKERNRILFCNRVYRVFAQLLLLIFFVNAGISCVVIQKNYLNNTTTTVFITNTLFMINRIYKALKITSSGEYNIYSAYRSDSIIYNRYRGSDWVPSMV